MATSDFIKQLIIAYHQKNEEEFYRIANEYIDFEGRKKNNFRAKDLKNILYNKSFFNNSNGNNYKVDKPIPRDSEKGFPLLEIKKFYNDWSELILDDFTINILKQIVREYSEKEILNTYNLKPKNKILFCGKPGTGKTFASQIISSVLLLPLIYLRFDSIVSSYLGETATNLRKVFDFISNSVYVVLFDEFDIIGKNRDDHYEHGEIKRVVNNFLQMLDNYNGDSLIIAATNHQHILDPAIWRRFDEVIHFNLPTNELRGKIFKLYLNPLLKDSLDMRSFINRTKDFSPSDIKLICIEALKKAILDSRSKIDTNDLNFAVSRLVERNKIRTGVKK